MIYDLEKSPEENRLIKTEIPKDNVTITNSYAGKYFFPEIENIETFEDNPYNTTAIYDDKKHINISILSKNKNKLIFQVRYPKIDKMEYLIIEETDKGLSKKVVDKIEDVN